MSGKAFKCRLVKELQQCPRDTGAVVKFCVNVISYFEVIVETIKKKNEEVKEEDKDKRKRRRKPHKTHICNLSSLA